MWEPFFAFLHALNFFHCLHPLIKILAHWSQINVEYSTSESQNTIKNWLGLSGKGLVYLKNRSILLIKPEWINVVKLFMACQRCGFKKKMTKKRKSNVLVMIYHHDRPSLSLDRTSKKSDVIFFTRLNYTANSN